MVQARRKQYIEIPDNFVINTLMSIGALAGWLYVFYKFFW